MSRATRAAVLSLVVVAAAVARPLGAQAGAERSERDLARRVAAAAAAGGGTARLAFAAREGVCGDGGTLVAEGLGPNETAIYFFQGTLNGQLSEISGVSITDDRSVQARCRPGLVRVALDMRGGRMTDARVSIGPARGTAGAGDVGVVPAAEAAAWFLGVARGATDDRSARTALLVANLADSARIVPQLIAMARDRALRDETRAGALRWIGRAADRGEGTAEADAAVRAIAADERDVAEVRERAVRTLRPGAQNDAFLRDLYARATPLPLRERIIRQLGDGRGSASAAWLEAIALRGAEPLSLRERAIRVLGDELGRPDRLRAIFPRVEESSLRERILRIVAEKGGADALGWLRTVAEDRASGTALRERAIRLLGEAGEQRYLRELYPRLDEASLRERVLRVAAEGGADGLRLVREAALRAEESAAVRERAVRLIAERGADGAELARLYDAIPEHSVRYRLVVLLAERGDDAALAKLRAVARSDPDPELRRRATRRLAERS